MQRLVGYTDSLVTHPGERVPLRVSSPLAWSASLVRLWHLDEEPVASSLDGRRFEAREHAVSLGSWVEVPDAGAVPVCGTFAVWVFLTRVAAGAVLFEGDGVRVGLDADRRVSVAVGDDVALSSVPVPLRQWRLVAASWGGASPATAASDEGVRVAHGGLDGREDDLVAVPAHPHTGVVEVDRDMRSQPRPPPVGGGAGWVIGRGLDGKVDRPALFGSVVGLEAVRNLLSGPGPATGDTVHAAWDLASDPASTRVPDVGPHGLHARLHGMPTRAVTSHDWSGDEDAWRHRPHEWSAVHLHADDLEDAGWPAAAELELPDDLPSGLYAVRVETEAEVDHLPFAVAPREPAARVAVLLPTFTYRAYANEAITPAFDVVTRGEADDRVSADGLLSQYNVHADGSGVVHASTRRPLLSVRPDHVYWLTGQPHGLSADLHLLTWLWDTGVEVDVLTDELLHEQQADLLTPYRVVITGSHHEYVTREEQTALRSYRDAGGHLMVLGGNSLQLVCGVHAERPHVTEVRRAESHVGLWQGAPGETHLAATGEPGGHWALRRERSRALTGLDLSGMGFDTARAYERTPRSYEPDVAWIFEGVADGPIGAAGLVMGGAAGYEVDSLDVAHGSSPDAAVLATARGFGADYVAAGPDPDIRADMVLIPAPSGGAVFAVGSIAWCGALPVNQGDNEVARITGNVLRGFAD